VTILIISEIKENAQNISQLLNNAGIQAEYSTTDTAKEKLNKFSPHLIIYNTVNNNHKLQEQLIHKNNIPFIVISDKYNQELAKDAITFNATYYLSKDVFFEQNLINITKNVLKNIDDNKKLLENKQLLEQLSDNTSSAIFLFQNEKFIKFNKSTEKLTGYSATELKRMNFWDVVHPESKELVKQRGLARQRGEKVPTNYEFKIITKSGQIIWVDFSAAKIEWNGQPASIGTAYNITGIKEAANKIAENEEKLRNLIQFAPDAVFLGDEKGYFINVNSMCTKLTGYSKEELLTMHISDLFPAEELKKNPLRFDMLNKGITLKKERYLQHKSGKLIPIEMHSKKLKNNTHLAFVRDISDRKHAEEIVFNEKERLSLILKSTVDGVITVDKKGYITLMNKAAATLTEFSQQQALLKPIDDILTLIDEETGDLIENPATIITKTGKVFNIPIQVILKTKNNNEKIVEITGSPMKNRKNKLIGAILVFRDITEKQKLIYAAQKNQKLDALGLLAGGIAHDFNNLLGSIFGYIDLSIRTTDNPKIKNYLEKVMATMERAQNLTRQLLTFAKGGEPVKETQSLPSFLKETVLFALSGTKTSAEFQLEKGLWYAKYDKNQLAQVIDNIVINACHAMPNGGTVKVSAKNKTITGENNVLPNGKYVEITIADEGVGIPNEIIPYIFDPFFTTKTEGHGLGLATCYSIIKRHKGEIKVTSKQGEGTTFKILIPASESTKIHSKGKTEKIEKGNGTILIMDDDEILRETLTEILKSIGYKVIAVDKGEKIIEYFKTNKNAKKEISAMIFDLTIQGGMGGKETIEHIIKMDIKLPVFVASGYAVDPIMANPNKFGFTDSIKKPFKIANLAQMLSKHLNKK
jgi:PAS domain S-box-containing protein